MRKFRNLFRKIDQDDEYEYFRNEAQNLTIKASARDLTVWIGNYCIGTVVEWRRTSFKDLLLVEWREH